MKWAFVIALLVASVPLGELAARPEFTHIAKEVAFAYGLAMLKESYRLGKSGRNADIALQDLDLNDGTVLEATDGNGRTFAYVAFSSKLNSKAGFYIVLEFCRGRLGEYAPSFWSSDLDLPGREKEFLSLEGDPTADFPGDCAHGL